MLYLRTELQSHENFMGNKLNSQEEMEISDINYREQVYFFPLPLLPSAVPSPHPLKPLDVH